MKLFLTGGIGAALLMGHATSQARADVPQPTYHIAATWKLAGEGGWDYLNLDSKKHRLYVARGNRIQVVNSDSGDLVGEVGGLSGAHGVALDPTAPRAYATSGKTNTVIVFDTETLQTVGEPIAVGKKPDAILFEPLTRRVWAFDAGSDEVSIIDPQTSKVIHTVALGGNPEFGVADGKGHVWVNIENTSELLELNVTDGKVMGRIALAPGEEPTGLAYDAASNLLFSGCANKTMVIIDAANGKVSASLPIGEGVDATAFDAKRGLAFSSNGEDGTISVIGMNGAKMAVLNTIPTHSGARTMTLNQENGAIFVVGAEYEAMLPGQKGWPHAVPGSTVIMKLEPGAGPL